MQGNTLQTVDKLLTPIIESLGFVVWGIEMLRGGKALTLRIYIDTDQGVTIEDCATVSHEISGILEVEDPINSDYHLEVSSPGLDRKIFYPDQYALFIGERLKLLLNQPIDGRKKYEGELIEATESLLKIECDGEAVAIAIQSINQARLIPDLSSNSVVTKLKGDLND